MSLKFNIISITILIIIIIIFVIMDNMTKILENGSIYTKYLEEHVFNNIFNETFSVEAFSKKYFARYSDSKVYYKMYIESSEINIQNYHNIINGPIKDLYKIKGVIDIKFLITKKNIIALLYPIEFFLQDNIINCIKTINKFNL